MSPDAFIRDRLFQPLVDRTGIDPQSSKRSMFSMFAIGLVATYVLVYLVILAETPPGTIPWHMPVILAFLTGVGIRQVWSQVSTQAGGMHPFAPAMRIMWVGLATMSTLMATTSIVVRANASAAGDVAGVLLSASWSMAVASAYLNVCRNPPPRKPRTTSVPALRSA